MLEITAEIRIPLHEIEFSYVRSSGPGGQNVNKVNSKAVLRWNPTQSRGIPEVARPRILRKLGPQLTSEGEVVLSSDRFRDQQRNREDCLEKLRELLVRAAERPKIRKKTQPTRSSERKRKELKSHNSSKKNLRGRVRDF